MTNDETFDVNLAKEKFIKRVIADFLDIIIISHFQQDPFSGYDVTKFVHKRLNVLLSPGTIYSTLYAMERDGLLESFNAFNKKNFKATNKGIQISKFLSSPKEVYAFIARVMEK